MLNLIQRGAVCQVVSLAMLTACQPGDRDAPHSGTPSDVNASTPSAAGPSSHSPKRQSVKHRSTDRRVAERFIAFADRPTDKSFRALSLSRQGVELGLGSRLTQHISVTDARNPAAWQISPTRTFRGSEGPFSALQLVSDHVTDDGEATHLLISVGMHKRCASPGELAPPTLRDAHRVSIQPKPGSITACPMWFGVDLYLSDAGKIIGATVDLWEP